MTRGAHEHDWLDDIALWATWCRAAHHSPHTLRLRTHYLAHLGGTYREKHPETVTTDDLAAMLARHGWSAETRKSARSAFRSFYRWMHVTGRIRTDPSAGLPPITIPRARPRPIPVATWSSAYAAAGPRERRALALARFAGLRRAEIAACRSEDVDDDGWLRVRGKGGHVRRVPVHPSVAAVLRDSDGWLFPGPDGHITADHLGRVANAALPPGWTLHTCRHRAGTDWLAVSHDLRVVQELLGHADPRTTAIYTLVPDPSLVAAVMGVA